MSEEIDRTAIVNKLVAENNGSPYHVVDGLKVNIFILQEEVDKLKTFQLYADDIFIVAYLKCGSTWMQQIVRLIHSNGVADGVELSKAVPWIEASKVFPANIDELSPPRAFKSHFPYDLCPCGPPNATPSKYICAIRNPKDVAVSFYFHYKRFGAPFFPDYDWDTFFEKFITGELEYGDYFDHILSWWSHRDDKNVLVVKYEDMKKDLPVYVSKIASFMGVNLSSDAITKIAYMSSFEQMKNDDTANYSWIKDNMKPGSTDFLRKGEVGDWKNYFTPEQSAQVDAMCAQRFKDTGLVFDFE